MNDTHRQTIRKLNDRLRCQHAGGQVVVTAGIDALGPENVLHIVREIAAFDAFTPDNDPHGEHDCATQTIDGHRIIWKIDYYDASLTFASPDPADPAVTNRVMTVMLADEY